MTALKELADRIDYGLTTSAVLEGDGPRFLRITDIDGPFVDWSTVPRCNASKAEVAKYGLVTGDVVVARTGASTGRSQWVQVNEQAVFASYLVRFRIRPEYDSRYIGYVLTSPPWHQHVASVAHGKSAQPNMSAAEMARFRFDCPSLPEQRAIADVLGALDDKIAANTKLIGITEALMIASLSAPGKRVPLSEIAIHRRETIDPQRIAEPSVEHFSLPAFDGGLGPERVSPKTIKSSKFLIEQPSVLASKLNPRFPRLWDVVELPSVAALASTEFLVLEPKFSSTSVLWATLAQPSFAVELQGKVAGTSGSHQRVKPADVLDSGVIDPRDLSGELHEQITSLAEAGRVHRKENRTLAATRDALLPQLMSGKLRVKDAEKVAADLV